jgi:predicted acylesterase/phospholipase RssA
MGGLLIPWLPVDVIERINRQTRPHVAQEELLKLEAASDTRSETEMRMAHGRLIERIKTEYDRYIAGERKEPPVINILVISSGGDYGAFGAGFLKGWRKVPPQHPLAKPEFDAVTGVSAGTLIAPFAFLGDDLSIDRVVHVFRNPQTDWVRERLLYFLPDNISFDDIPGLEREVRKSVNMEMVRRIVEAGAGGRVLAVNTTNVDQGTSHVFNLVTEAQRAVASEQLERFHNIMLASAGIPGAFPFRMIDGELY